MSEETVTHPSQSPVVAVVVTKLPEVPSKPLLKDSTRLLALAAFLFSVTTGLYATYQTWISNREARVDAINKLIDQYYAGQETLATLNPQTQNPYINLLQSQLRSMAARTIPHALQVQGDINDGTWLALAQINDNEGHFATAEIAWLAAKNKAQDVPAYTFAMRGLASNLFRLRQQNG